MFKELLKTTADQVRQTEHVHVATYTLYYRQKEGRRNMVKLSILSIFKDVWGGSVIKD